MSDGSPFSGKAVFNWERIKTDHFMQCFGDNEALAEAVGSFLHGALQRKHAALIVGTPEHIYQVGNFLKANDLDPLILQRAGQYIPLDAAETLERCCVDGRPDRKQFFDVIGRLISQAYNSWGGVSAFGEMVNLLWTEGKKSEALELEQLWNCLAKIYPFALFCGYSKDAFDGDDDRFSQVCEAHSMVIL